MVRTENQIRTAVREFVRALEPKVHVQFDDLDKSFAREIARTGKVIYRAPGKHTGRTRRSKASSRRLATRA